MNTYALSPIHIVQYQAEEGTFTCNGQPLPIYFDDKGGSIKLGQYRKRALAVIKQIEGIPSNVRCKYLDGNNQNLKRHNLLFGIDSRDQSYHDVENMQQQIIELQRRMARLEKLLGE